MPEAPITTASLSLRRTLLENVTWWRTDRRPKRSVSSCIERDWIRLLVRNKYSCYCTVLMSGEVTPCLKRRCLIEGSPGNAFCTFVPTAKWFPALKGAISLQLCGHRYHWQLNSTAPGYTLQVIIYTQKKSSAVRQARGIDRYIDSWSTQVPLFSPSFFSGYGVQLGSSAIPGH